MPAAEAARELLSRRRAQEAELRTRLLDRLEGLAERLAQAGPVLVPDAAQVRDAIAARLVALGLR